MNCQPTTDSNNKALEIEIPKVNAVHHRLDNGIHLIVAEDFRSDVVSIQAWCKAGSITEGKWLGSGVSHILEHMLFKGTERRGNSEIAQTIQSIGGYTNAYTSFDRTVYYIDAPSAGWRTALDVLSDAIFFSTLPPDEYTKEMEVVRREFAMGFDDPMRTLQRLLFSTAFNVHPYQYPVIGHLDLFNRLTRDDVMAYYKQFYAPNNLTFVVAGAVDAAEVRAELERLTANLKRSPVPDVYIPAEPRQLGRREQHLPFKTDATRFYLAWHIPGITHPDLYALDVLAILAGQGRSSRLHRALVEEQGVLRGVGAFSYTPAQSGLWAISGTMHPASSKSRDEVVAAVIEQLSAFAERQVDQAELAKAKRQVLADHIGGMTTVAGLAASLGSGWFVANDPRFDERYLQGIANVTAEDLRRVARTYLIDDALTVVSINPLAKSDSSTSITEATTGAAADSQSKARVAPILESLNNGLRLIRLEDRALPLVHVGVTLRGGLLLEEPTQAGISHLMAQLLQKGTKQRDAAALALAIEEVGGSLSVESGNNSITATISVLEPDLPLAIKWLAEVVLEPAFAEDELERERSKQLSDIALENDEPMRVARNHLRQALFGMHPYARNTLGSEQSVSALTREDIVKFHRQLLVPERCVLWVAGAHEAESARKLLEQSFPAGRFDSQATLPQHTPDFSAKGETIVVPTDKVQAVVQIGIPGIAVDSPDRVAMDVIDQALSDIASRLFVRIREKQSLAYFVGASQLVGTDPGYFMAYAGTRPETAEKVRDELLAELNDVSANGLKHDEFERARAKLNGTRLLQNQSAARRAQVAALNVLYGLGIEYEENYQKELAALTPEKLRAVAARIFKPDAYTCVIVQPSLTTKP